MAFQLKARGQGGDGQDGDNTGAKRSALASVDPKRREAVRNAIQQRLKALNRANADGGTTETGGAAPAEAGRLAPGRKLKTGPARQGSPADAAPQNTDQAAGEEGARELTRTPPAAEDIDAGEILARLDELIREAGAPLTAEGGLLERPPEQREIMVLFENGLFLVSRSHQSDPYVLKLESYARLRGISIERKMGVPLEVVKEAYLRSGGETNKASATQMQKDIVRLIETAVHESASDIHIIVEPNRCIVEMRMNGVLKQSLEWRSEYGADFCSACFAMADASDANYNPNEYQAARISRTSADLPDTVQALRLQFNPLAYGGRYLIMRLLYRGSSEERAKAKGNVEGLGYTPEQFNIIKKMIATPVGIGIISGPTGSGKSTTLFHVLSTVLEDCNYERNVLTIEDPPERPIFGAKQMPVTNAPTPEERSRKFIQAISSAMRSDPDTIMIGEVRDKQSGKLAIEAAMTGHQVWTTVHANDALMITNRMRDIGVEEYNLFTPGMIFGLIGQRLTRSLCKNCRIPLKQAIDDGLFAGEMLDRFLSVTDPDDPKNAGIYWQGPGCDVCGAKKGYAGRTVVAEVIYPNEELMQLLRADNRTAARDYWLRELGGVSMMQHAFHKMRQGEIPPGEIERVVGPFEVDPLAPV